MKVGEKMIVHYEWNRGKVGENMSSVLNKIKGKTPEELLKEYSDPKYLTTDVFGMAKQIGIDIYDADFNSIEEKAGEDKDSIYGAIIDDDENDTLSVYLKDRLEHNSYYDSKTDAEKREILRHRQRFTLAHELAHACVDFADESRLAKVDFRKNLSLDNTDEKEMRANIFAGELLISEDSLRFARNALINPSVSRLCEIFDVSKHVMCARLDYLGITY